MDTMVENKNNLAIAVSEKKSNSGVSKIAGNLNITDFLGSIKEFQNISKQDLESLASCSRLATINSGEYIAVEGDEENPYGFIVVTGRLAMLKTSVSGKELIVELLAPRDIFGLLVKFSLEVLPEQLSAKAQLRSQILWLPVSRLITIIKENPRSYRACFTHILNSMQSAHRLSHGLAHDRVEVRIATILSILAVKFARLKPAPQDQTIDITRQQIADLVGTTSETAIRVTRAMQKEGLIDIKKPGVLRVIDLERLQLMSDGDQDDGE